MNTVHVCGQWQIRVADNGSYDLVNLGPQGQQRFYRAVSGKYGEPILEPEPDLAVVLPTGLRYVDAAGADANLSEKISGIICKDKTGAVVVRLSLTNAAEKGIAWSLDEQGRLEVDGRVFWLRVLVSKDKNRIKNYDAFFSEFPHQGTVVFYELETLPLF